MLASVLRAPLSYFETQPQGRILSRFTYDTEVVDILLTENLAMFMIAIGWFVAGIILMASILPWMVLALAPVTFLYWMLLLHYRKSGVDFQRLDALSRSPIQAMVTEVLDGSSTIRVFRREPIFIARFQDKVNRNSSGKSVAGSSPSLRCVSTTRSLLFTLYLSFTSYVELCVSTAVVRRENRAPWIDHRFGFVRSGCLPKRNPTN